MKHIRERLACSWLLILLLCSMMLAGCSAEKSETMPNEAASASAVGQETARSQKQNETDKLASWADNSVNKAVITEFVKNVTDEKSEKYVPAEKRIATFDMDGTVVAEKELWLELAVAVDRIDKELSDDRELVAKKDELLKNIKMDPEPEGTGKLIEEVTGQAFKGVAQDEFIRYMSEFMQQKKGDLGELKYADTFYKPMLELIQYLQDNDFTVYLVSGSERGVIWGATSGVLSLPRTQMIGADMGLELKRADKKSKMEFYEPGDEIIRKETFTQKNIGDNKIYNIYHQIGICPILACGNTDGDFSMLNYARHNPEYEGLALLIKHDDKEREYYYNVLEDWDKKAEKYDWHVVSMQKEFESVFLKEVTK